MFSRFPIYKQHDAEDCGAACLRMIAKYHGKTFTMQTLRERTHISRIGVSLLGLSNAAESIGFRTHAAKSDFGTLRTLTTPLIVFWEQRHFVIVIKVEKNKVTVADPAHGIIRYSSAEFLKGWLPPEQQQGIVLLLEPTPSFHRADDENEVTNSRSAFSFLSTYIAPYKQFIVQLLIGAIVISVIGIIFPLLTQSLVDIGINTRNTEFVTIVLISQLVLFLSKVVIEFLRSRILLHIGSRINISLIADFLRKIMRLPISFFETKKTGDILQRIQDHKRIETLLTSSSISVVFSLFTLLVFGVMFFLYSTTMFIVFFAGTLLSVLWILAFLKKRADIDHKRFRQLSDNQNSLIQLIHGVQEIKLHNIEMQKRWEWERLQAKMFHLNVKALALAQKQQSGILFINELKNIVITFLAAHEVLNGNMTIGMMLSVSYILGVLNSPVEQLLGFFLLSQDARLSLERMAEIHAAPNEEQPDLLPYNVVPQDKSIYIHNLSFHYTGPHSPAVLDSLTFSIPEGKITALVGTSGSGKSTLLKLLLKFYEPTAGTISIGDTDLQSIAHHSWRDACGVVLQDGFIFSDTIARNIAPGEEKLDRERLEHAVKVANIREFITGLPLGYSTKIGQEGLGLSTGQQQRLLIARAVYKNPDYLFFDEATSALDALNEKTIVEQLNTIYKGKTVLIIAHRLSTVKNADNIVVLHNGKIVEQGNHEQLLAQRGAYFSLVKNQLELGA